MNTKFETLLDVRSYSETLAKLMLQVNKTIKSYVEFGSYNGTSLITTNEVLKYLNHKDAKYFAFDSFRGLPKLTTEDDSFTFKEGMFSCSRKDFDEYLIKNKFPIDRLTVHEGYFCDTFKTIDKSILPTFDLIMFDCDIYSSTKEALNFSVDFIVQDAILIFDDWFSSKDNEGQQKAFKEFLHEQKKFTINHFEVYKYFGRNAGCIFYIDKNDTR